MLFGESGIGKSTFARTLAGIFHRAGHSCFCLGADPGSPAFGAPGAVALARFSEEGWAVLALEAVCTLDAGRFRLPLTAAVARLARGVAGGVLLLDTPGVVRGVAAAELVTGLAQAAAIDTVLLLVRPGKRVAVANELACLGCELIAVAPSPSARLPGPRQRARVRTRLWEGYLERAVETTIRLPSDRLTGTPPPLGAVRDWRGRQLALLHEGRTLALGEVLALHEDRCRVRIAESGGVPDQFLVRDACRLESGWLGSARPEGVTNRLLVPPSDLAPFAGYTPGEEDRRPVVRIGEATATLVNGVFGDPLLHLRLHNRKRSVLFDLGEGGRLPARIAHQVSEVFISHAHIDHISGFLWLLRSRIGEGSLCRLFGPPGMADHIAGLISGIHWDRIGDLGPPFTVSEIHGNRLKTCGLRAGWGAREELGEREVTGGLILDEPAFKVWAVTLDHGRLPVMAYACEQAAKINVREEELQARRLAAGPWLGELKRRVAGHELQGMIRLPDSTHALVCDLVRDLLTITPASKLVYATDLADSAPNRRQLAALALGAHTLFCEATFLEQDRGRAERHGHLTAAVCGTIALDAGVERLAPFHFSRRYEAEPFLLYDEIREVYPGTILEGRRP